MGESIRTVIERNCGRMRDGDVFMLNDPYHGGTHLPDDGHHAGVRGRLDAPLFYVGSRGHHADIGGTTPASMPPDSTHIDEEGVLIDNWQLVSAGTLRDAQTRALLASAATRRATSSRTWPTCARRSPRTRRASTSCAEWSRSSAATSCSRSWGTQDNAEEAVRRVIGALQDGAYRYPLDNGAEIRVAIRVDRRRGARKSISRARPRSSTTTSTRRRPCAWPPCCTCSARWSATTSR